jgi:hypothetical protein
MARLITRGRTRPFSRLADRVRSLDAIGEGAIRQIRFGPEGVEAQFMSQGEIGESGFRPWLQSQRAKRRGGLTLVDTGKYLRAWTGRGAGAIAEQQQTGRGLRIRVGVDPTQLPQVRTFQRTSPLVTRRGARIAQRPVRLNPGTVERIGKLVLRHVVTS